MAKKDCRVTPECQAKYLWLFEPNTQYDPEYTITCIREDTPAWAALIKYLEDKLEAYCAAQDAIAGKKVKRCEHRPWKTKDDQNVLVCKANATGTVKKTGKVFSNKPRIVGPNLKPIADDYFTEPLGEGTVVKVGFQADTYTDERGCAISLRLKHVQIIKPEFRDSLAAYRDVSNPDAPAFTAVLADWYKDEGVTPSQPLPAQQGEDSDEDDEDLDGGTPEHLAV
jgi:hypothetical protein